MFNRLDLSRAALAAQLANAERFNEAQEARAASTLDNVAFSLKMVLRGSPLTASLDTDALAQDLADRLQQYESWPYNERLESQVRQQVYSRLLPQLPRPVNVQAARMLVDDLLRMHRTVL